MSSIVPSEHFNHTHVNVCGLRIGFMDLDRSSSNGHNCQCPLLPLVETPIDTNILVSDCILPGYNHHPTRRMGFFVSPVRFNVSEQRARDVCGAGKFFDYLSTLQYPTPETSTAPPSSFLPRVQELVNHVQLKVDMECPSISVSILADESNISTKAREVLLEEALHDFLSQCSTHLKLNGVTNLNLAATRQLFVDKMCGVGLSITQARMRIREIEKKFFDDIEEMQQHLIMDDFNDEYEEELDESQLVDESINTNSDASDLDSDYDSEAPEDGYDGAAVGSKQPKPNEGTPRRDTYYFDSVRRSSLIDQLSTKEMSSNLGWHLRNDNDMSNRDDDNDDDDGNGSVSSQSSSSDSSTNTSRSNDDSQHSDSSSIAAERVVKDSIISTVGYYLDEILPKILCDLEIRTFNKQRELLVIEAKSPQTSLLQLVYDERVTVSASALNVRNGAGVYFMRVRDGDKTSVDLYCTNEAMMEDLEDDAGGACYTSNAASPTGSTEDGTSGGSATGVEGRPKSDGKENCEGKSGIKLTRLYQDRNSGFGTGGVQASCLDADKNDIALRAAATREREIHTILTIGTCDVVVCPVAYIGLLETTSKISASFVSAGGDDGMPRNTTVAEIETLSVTCTSDEMGPFMKVNMAKSSIERSCPPRSDTQARTRIMSEEFLCFNLSPEGQSYQRVISPAAGAGPGVQKSSVPFFLEMFEFKDFWRYPTRVNVKISHSNIIILYRWVNEMMQYFINPKILMGSFVDKFFQPKKLDKHMNPPPPMLWSLLLNESSILMPRNTCSKDLVALRADDVYVFNSFEWESFKVPTTPPSGAKSNKTQHSPDIAFEGRDRTMGATPQRRYRGSTFSAGERMTRSGEQSMSPEIMTSFAESFTSVSSSNNIEGHAMDCGIEIQQESFDEESASTDSSMDQFMDAKAEDASFVSAVSAFAHDADSSIESGTADSGSRSTEPISSYNEKDLVPRITVQAKDLRVLTSLGLTLDDGAASLGSLAFLLSSAKMNPIKSGEKTYSNSCEDDDLAEGASVKDYAWQEVTCNPVELEVVVDYDPHMRLMVSDFITSQSIVDHVHAKEKSPRSFSVSLSQSQFYLLLSIWYCNMQELPVMFPYTPEELLLCSVYPKAPQSWPEYGTDDWVHHMMRSVETLNFECLVRFRDFSIDCSFNEAYFETNVDCIFMCKETDGNSRINTDDQCIPSTKLRFEDILLSVSIDHEGLLKVAAGATSFQLMDERNPAKSFNKNAFCCGNKMVSSDDEELGVSKLEGSFGSWIDDKWGLKCGRHTLLDKLPQPFNLTVFMTPDMYCHVNVGFDNVDGFIKDLAPIWMAIDFFGSYFQKPEFGMPSFSSEASRNRALNISSSVATDVKSDNMGAHANMLVRDCQEECLNIDIRVWVNRPHIVLPEEPLNIDGMCILLESEAGLFYRYKTLGYDLWNQEFVAKDMAAVAMKRFMSPEESRGIRGMHGTGRNVATLLEGLSISYIQNTNCENNHSDTTIKFPVEPADFLDASKMNGIESPQVNSRPFVVPSPKAVSPKISPRRNLGQNICEFYLSYDQISILTNIFTDFAGPYPPEDGQTPAPPESKKPTYSILANISGFRLFLVDPVLGMHLPIAKACIANLNVSISQLPSPAAEYSVKPEGHGAKKEKKRESQKRISIIGVSDADYDLEPNLGSTEYSSTPPSSSINALQVGADLHVWADYFNNTLNCWEPLVEPYQCYLLYEKCAERGEGLTLRAECPLHVNLSGALFDTLDDALQTFAATTAEEKPGQGSGKEKEIPGTNGILKRPSIDYTNTKRYKRAFPSFTFMPEEVQSHGRAVTVTHEAPSILSPEHRVAFSLVNLAGQRVRFHQLSNGDIDRANLKYLKHGGRARLQFAASTTIVLNKNIIEVPFELQHGVDDRLRRLEKSDRNSESQFPLGLGLNDDAFQRRQQRHNGSEALSSLSSGGGRVGAHGINMQVAGFKWMANLPADALGSRFESMTPRDLTIEKKIKKDWRLQNVVQLVTEVKPYNGGRQLTVRTVFRIQNRTGHPMLMSVNPDPSHQPNLHIGHYRGAKNKSSGGSGHGGADSTREAAHNTKKNRTFDAETEFCRIEPGETYNVPFLLLEKALLLEGNHLGSIWIRPDKDADGNSEELFASLMSPTGATTSSETCAIRFSAHPIQLAKIVRESHELLKSNEFNTIEPKKAGTGMHISCPVYHSKPGISVAPFCYCLEVKRSTIQPRQDKDETRESNLNDIAAGKGLAAKRPRLASKSSSENESSILRGGRATPTPTNDSLSSIGRRQSRVAWKKRAEDTEHLPVSYTLVVHPPIVIENLLPEGGTFELMHATRRVVVWWGYLQPGECVPVHTVGLDAPLLLLVNLGFCRTPHGEGALIHDGVVEDSNVKGESFLFVIFCLPAHRIMRLCAL